MAKLIRPHLAKLSKMKIDHYDHKTSEKAYGLIEAWEGLKLQNGAVDENIR